MARKNLLKGLMDDTAAAEKTTGETPNSGDIEPRAPVADAPAPPPKYKKGAIGAVSRSIADLKSRSVVELDPFDIKSGGLADRLEHDEADHQLLMKSMQDYGQQVPVLVRPSPDAEGEYQIVYGRRRVLALRDLGLPVKAMIRDLDDRAVVMAQGQENSARRDLSFIERVNFARQMQDAGYAREVIADALSADKSLISRMMAVAKVIPVEVIEMIGAAPGIGRDRWIEFSKRWSEKKADVGDAHAMLGAGQNGATSDGRFETLFGWLDTAQAPAPAPRVAKAAARNQAPLKRPDGRVYGSVSRSEAGVRIEVKTKVSRGFDDWLAENIESIHRQWLNDQSHDEG